MLGVVQANVGEKLLKRTLTSPGFGQNIGFPKVVWPKSFICSPNTMFAVCIFKLDGLAVNFCMKRY
jgi:hypothetical protein